VATAWKWDRSGEAAQRDSWLGLLLTFLCARFALDPREGAATRLLAVALALAGVAAIVAHRRAMARLPRGPIPPPFAYWYWRPRRRT